MSHSRIIPATLGRRPGATVHGPTVLGVTGAAPYYFRLEEPAASDVFDMQRTPYPITVVQIGGITDTGTANFNIEERSDPDTSGTDIMASDLQATASGAETDTFSNAYLPAGTYPTVTITSVASTPTIFRCWIYYRVHS